MQPVLNYCRGALLALKNNDIASASRNLRAAIAMLDENGAEMPSFVVLHSLMNVTRELENLTENNEPKH
jgi:hypothetical protein